RARSAPGPHRTSRRDTRASRSPARRRPRGTPSTTTALVPCDSALPRACPAALGFRLVPQTRRAEPRARADSATTARVSRAGLSLLVVAALAAGGCGASHQAPADPSVADGVAAAV